MKTIYIIHFLFAAIHWHHPHSPQSQIHLCDMEPQLQLAMRQIAAERANQQSVPTHCALQKHWFEQRAGRKRAAPTPKETTASTPKPEQVDADGG